eukprot:scaffold1347_cov350-Pavlova_lutheri.AAC.19
MVSRRQRSSLASISLDIDSILDISKAWSDNVRVSSSFCSNAAILPSSSALAQLLVSETSGSNGLGTQGISSLVGVLGSLAKPSRTITGLEICTAVVRDAIVSRCRGPGMVASDGSDDGGESPTLPWPFLLQQMSGSSSNESESSWSDSEWKRIL